MAASTHCNIEVDRSVRFDLFTILNKKIDPWNVSIVSCYIIILAVRAGDAIAR